VLSENRGQVTVNETFAHSYLVDPNPDWPASNEPILDFVSDEPILGMRSPEKLHVRFYPAEGAGWTGRFECGVGATRESRGPYLTEILCTPEPDTCCVVANGLGYWVSVSRRKAISIPFVPITQVLPAERERLLLFADFWSVAAYQNKECAWKTGRVFDDDAYVESVCNGIVAVSGFVGGDENGRSYFSAVDGRELPRGC
jgi:hypothetical protein